MDYIPISQPYIGEEEADAVYRQAKSGWISMGRKVEELEKLICEYTGVKFAVAMSNGTATLHAALMALGVGHGDEVVLPTLTYISSANAVLYCGAVPVFCEVDPQTFNVTAETIRSVVTDRTKVVMPVDLKGQPADFDEINLLAKKFGIKVLSDSAESFGAIYKGSKVGTQCRVHSFSFFANKNVTMGEGGVITTNDSDLAHKCRVIRNQGQSERYVHVMIGHNYRLTDLAAAFGVEQIKRVDWIMEEKGRIAAFYNNAFKGHPLIKTPYLPDYADRPSWYMYCLSFADNVNRDNVIRVMHERGVDHRLSFPPVHLQPIYREMFSFKEGNYPISEKIFNKFIDVPCWVGMTDEQMGKVVNVTIEAVERCQE
jgi:perosamine synthetase